MIWKNRLARSTTCFLAPVINMTYQKAPDKDLSYISYNCDMMGHTLNACSKPLERELIMMTLSGWV